MEGVGRYQVRLLPHQAAWDEEFLRVKKELTACWGEHVLDIQHVGSTAIPAICAKPILDVAVKLRSIRALDVKALTDCGYEYRGARAGNENYHLFVLRGEGQISLRHIHCYDQAEKEFALLVGFRDYLNAHPEEAAAYQALKMQLAARYAEERYAYTKGKEAFIRSIYEKMGKE